MNRRPIVHDSSFPITGSRDRRRAFDNDPTIARPRLVDHLRRSMGAANFATALDLLNAWGDSLLGLSGETEGDPSAMDARVRDHGPSQLSRLFADAPNPSARNYR